jgi:hypothetical protein
VRRRTVNLRRPADLLANDITSRGRGEMGKMVRLAGLSAVLAAALVLATGERDIRPAAGTLRPSLLVTID